MPLCRPHVFLQTPHGFSIGGSGRDGGVMSCPFSARTPVRVYPCIRPSVHPFRGGGDPARRHPPGRGAVNQQRPGRQRAEPCAGCERGEEVLHSSLPPWINSGGGGTGSVKLQPQL